MPKKTILFYCLLMFLFSCNKKDEPQDNIKPKQPNIIFLLADDQRADGVGFMGNEHIITPNLDSLAEKGTVFNNAYVTTSICAVSRASILTGQYARRHDIWGFAKNFTKTQLDSIYPLVLSQNGYYTGFIGKYGVGNQLPKDKFDYWRGFAGQGSFKQVDSLGKPIHLTKKINGQIQEFINLQKKESKPFCLSVSFKAPHVEGDPGYFLPDENYTKMFEADTLPVPKSSNEAFFNYFPKKFTENNVARNRWQTRFATPVMQQENIKKYYQLIHGIDNAVGDLVNSLRINGLLENTIIIYTSDNGFYLGEYGFAGKWYGSEPSIKVPLMIFDGRKQHTKKLVRDDIALNIDIAPTILGIAGIKIPKVMQGKNLLLKGVDKNYKDREVFFYEHLWQSSTAYYIPSTEGIVYKDKKYMRYFMNRDTTDVIFEEAYNLTKDPIEINNLVFDEKHQSFIEDLRNSMYLLKNKSK